MKRGSSSTRACAAVPRLRRRSGASPPERSVSSLGSNEKSRAVTVRGVPPPAHPRRTDASTETAATRHRPFGLMVLSRALGAPEVGERTDQALLVHQEG